MKWTGYVFNKDRLIETRGFKDPVLAVSAWTDLGWEVLVDLPDLKMFRLVGWDRIIILHRS